MVKFGTDNIEDSMKLGREAAAYVSTFFKSPIKLEFEKVYYPFLLMNKKRYAGMLWTKTDEPDKMDCKGIETVRRDSCALVAEVVQKTLNHLLKDEIERSKKKKKAELEGEEFVGADPKETAKNYCKGMISDLLQNRIDLSLLVITKGLGKRSDEESKAAGKNTYTARQAHVELAEKMRKRDEASAPNVGDRVAYVMI